MFSINRIKSVIEVHAWHRSFPDLIMPKFWHFEIVCYFSRSQTNVGEKIYPFVRHNDGRVPIWVLTLKQSIYRNCNQDLSGSCNRSVSGVWKCRILSSLPRVHQNHPTENRIMKKTHARWGKFCAGIFRSLRVITGEALPWHRWISPPLLIGEIDIWNELWCNGYLISSSLWKPGYKVFCSG